MDRLSAIWTNFFNMWVAENGLAKIPADGDRVFYDGYGLKSVANDNGILFLCYFILLSKVAGLKSEIHAKRLIVGSTIERLERAPHRGLFDRVPIHRASDMRTPERHDNYVGICALSVLYGFAYQSEIISYGSRNGWNFNNVEPEKYDLKSVRQGGDVAFYYLCNRETPSIVDFVWMIGGIISNMFDKDAGRTLLCWARLYTLSSIGQEIPNLAMRMILFTTIQIWKIFKSFQFDNIVSVVRSYFGINNPYELMARECGDRWGI